MGLCVDPKQIDRELDRAIINAEEARESVHGDFEDVDRGCAMLKMAIDEMVSQYGYMQALYEKMRREHFGK